MIPYIQKGILLRLPEKRRKKICKCKVTCECFFTIAMESDDIILCQNDAKEFTYQMIRDLGIEFEKTEVPEKFGWTSQQERIVIDYLKTENCYDENGKIRQGTLTRIAKLVGKSRDRVNSKVKYLRRQDKL